MILNIHLDVSYLSVRNGRSRACGHFFLGSMPKNGDTTRLNGAISTLYTILKSLIASVAEAELGVLCMCVKEGRIMRLISKVGYPQLATPIHCDNATAVGIVNGKVKIQRSRCMEMRYFYSWDQVKRGFFDVKWHQGQENLGNYQSKTLMRKHHVNLRPMYLHTKNSTEYILRAMKTSELRGCVENKVGAYVLGRPLPVFPKYSS